ncbi:MAG: UPF0158 family protein [Flavobacteriales bacterium]
MAIREFLTNEEYIRNIAEDMDMGLLVYVHRQTGKTIEIPAPEDHDDSETELWKDSINEIKKKRKDYFEVERWTSSHMYQFMEDFVNTEIKDPLARNLLTSTLNGRKPFQNFKNLVEQSDELRETWFKFKLKCQMTWVRNKLQQEFKL